MAEYARGAFLGAATSTADSQPVLLYKANIDTEVTVVTCAFRQAESPVRISLFHTEPDEVPPLPDSYGVLLEFPVTDDSQGAVIATEAIGGSIFLRPKESLYIAADKVCQFRMYGVTSALTPFVR